MPKSTLKKAFIWNTVATITYGLMSFLWTLFVIRYYGGEVGGMFSICFTMSQTIQMVGYFSMRNFQVTDVKPKYTFNAYFISRVISIVIMILACFFWIIYSGYENEKSMLFVSLTAIKVAECLADIYEGRIQQSNRLDISAKCLFIRTIIIVVMFLLLNILIDDLLMSSAITAIFSLILVFVVSIPAAKHIEKTKFQFDIKGALNLLLECFPLFLISILSTYSNNISKVSIDTNLDYITQSVYSIIYLPALATVMVSAFVFRPFLNDMARYYQKRDKISFNKIINRLILAVFVIFAVVFLCVFILGVPLLSFLYNIDISSYKPQLLIITVASLFVALLSIYNNVIIIMRLQKMSLITSAFVCIIAVMVSDTMVINYGITGAALNFCLVSFLNAITIAGIYYLFKNKKFREKDN